MKLLTFALGLAFAVFDSAQSKKIVCYYSSWAVYYSGNHKVAPTDLDPHLCTHILYAFVAVNSDGSLKVEDQNADISMGGYKNLVALKKKNANLKVMLSIGGASAPSQTFSKIAASSGKRAAIVGSARWFMQTYGFDGVDLDWEVPNGGDRGNYIKLLQDFKNDFKKNGWLISAAVSANPAEGYDVKQMSNILDFINIMSYDMYGPWSAYTGQNSALYASHVESHWEKKNLNMAACLNNWKNAGADPNKIIGGIAFYGHSFNLKNANNHGIHAAINGAGRGGPVVKESGSWTYFEFCESRSSWGCTWDAEQKMPICTQGTLWLGIDDEGSIRNKVAYINSNGFGGAMIWSIDQDDVHGHCGAGKPLLRAIKDNLH